MKPRCRHIVLAIDRLARSMMHHRSIGRKLQLIDDRVLIRAAVTYLTDVRDKLAQFLFTGVTIHVQRSRLTKSRAFLSCLSRISDKQVGCEPRDSINYHDRMRSNYRTLCHHRQT